jgi:hypothetical protein
VPEYHYDIFVFSDHGQVATTPFERVMGRDLHAFVLEHASSSVARTLKSEDVRRLVSLRATEFWTRTLFKGLRGPARLYVAWLRRRLQRSVRPEAWKPLDAIHVVTGGSIAHIYFDRGAAPRDVDAIDREHPGLLAALSQCPAVGLMVGRGADGPVVFYRGGRHRLGERRALERLPPFRQVGYDLLATHLLQAAEGERSGDLVLYGAFAEAGDIAFDFEFGSHGGIGPDELDQFMMHPSEIAVPFDEEVEAEELYRFFSERYSDDAEVDADPETLNAA